MKIDARSADRFAAKPYPDIRAVLVYGPDDGLVKERADMLTASVVEDPRDPFRVAELSVGDLKDDPARLTDEVAAMAFGGGRRVVRLRSSEDSLAPLFASFLAAPPGGDTLVVLEAGDLPPRSKLRALFEKETSSAALPCYRDEEGTLESLIRETFAQAGYRATPEAIAFLRDHLGTNRLLTRRELEKLMLYKGPVEDGHSSIDMDDVLACVGDSAHLTLDDLSFAVGDGDLAQVERSLTKAFAEGLHAVPLLRAVSGHFIRLQTARGHLDQGQSSDQAVAKLRPPVFFKTKDRFKRQLGRWGAVALGTAINRLLDAEMDCKRTGAPSEMITSRALFELTARAPKSRGGRG